MLIGCSLLIGLLTSHKIELLLPKAMRRCAFTMLVFLLFADFVDAQGFLNRRRDRKWMFSSGIGFSTYHGDLYAFDQDKLQGISGNIGLGLRRKIGSQLSLRLDFNTYRIQAADSLEHKSTLFPTQDPPDRAQRNLSFRAINIEGSILAIFDLIPIKGSYSQRPTLNPYIFLGLGVSTNNPKAFYQGEWYDLRSLQTEGESYSGITTIVPLGLGLRVKITPFSDILFEIGRRSAGTDRLDDVSTKHVNLSIFDQIHAGDPSKIGLAKALSDRAQEAGFSIRSEGRVRGHDDKNDAYFLFQMRFEIYLPDFKNLFSSDKKKPKFR